MAILKSSKTEYEFSLGDVKKLIAADLKVMPSDIEVTFPLIDTSDDRGGPPSYSVKCVKVIVDETKNPNGNRS